MALNEAECKQCQVELDKMRTLPGELASMPEAQARIVELEAALDSECSDDSSSGSAAAGVAVVVGLGALGAIILRALLGRRQ